MSPFDVFSLTAIVDIRNWFDNWWIELRQLLRHEISGKSGKLSMSFLIG
jgi:hypothetical protein